ncbi:unnamed protein product [Amoebophrya sp. A120]|nr:unnamed protein product [Amoebophrya sp. A120]|eukprot:GSA120T00001966001.1
MMMMLSDGIPRPVADSNAMLLTTTATPTRTPREAEFRAAMQNLTRPGRTGKGCDAKEQPVPSRTTASSSVARVGMQDDPPRIDFASMRCAARRVSGGAADKFSPGSSETDVKNAKLSHRHRSSKTEVENLVHLLQQNAYGRFTNIRSSFRLMMKNSNSSETPTTTLRDARDKIRNFLHHFNLSANEADLLFDSLLFLDGEDDHGYNYRHGVADKNEKIKIPGPTSRTEDHVDDHHGDGTLQIMLNDQEMNYTKTDAPDVSYDKIMHRLASLLLPDGEAAYFSSAQKTTPNLVYGPGSLRKLG